MVKQRIQYTDAISVRCARGLVNKIRKSHAGQNLWVWTLTSQNEVAEAVLDFARDRLGAQDFLHLTLRVPAQAALSKNGWPGSAPFLQGSGNDFLRVPQTVGRIDPVDAEFRAIGESRRLSRCKIPRTGRWLANRLGSPNWRLYANYRLLPPARILTARSPAVHNPFTSWSLESGQSSRVRGFGLLRGEGVAHDFEERTDRVFSGFGP